jgi:PKD repeat protein
MYCIKCAAIHILEIPNATGENFTYQWDFGDGNTGNGATTTHTYAAAGNYVATVTASNGTESRSATTSVRIVDEIEPLPPSTQQIFLPTIGR